jgi:nucleoside-diphosphate-sugar epimerase
MLQHLNPSSVKPQRVVILGASGFIAKNLAERLPSEGINFISISSREVNLLDSGSAEQLKQILKSGDSLVITSALTPDKGKDVATLMKNLTMAQHIASAIEATDLHQIIYISSDAVYPNSASPIRETSPREAADLYSLMHIAREQIFQTVAGSKKTPLCIFCPSAIYGTGDTHNSYGPNRFLRTAIQDKKITLFGNGEEMRDHIHIDDVVSLLVLCLGHRSHGTLNAVTGQALSFHDVATKIAESLGSGNAIECKPRSSPVTHRHFDATERIKAFPDFVPSPIERYFSSKS